MLSFVTDWGTVKIDLAKEDPSFRALVKEMIAWEKKNDPKPRFCETCGHPLVDEAPPYPKKFKSVVAEFTRRAREEMEN